MAVLPTEELEELLEELEGQNNAAESLPLEIESLLRDLQPARRFTSRLRAARQLGEVSSSSRQIVQSLATVAELDHSDEVRAVAAESLRAPVHQEYLQEVLDRKNAVDMARQQRLITRDQVPQTGELAGRRMPEQQSRVPLQCLKAGSVVGVVVGLAIGLLGAPQPGLPVGGMMVATLAAGAVLGAAAGAVQGAEGRGLRDRITGIAVGAIAAAVIAPLLWWPAAIVFRICGFLSLILR